MAYNLYYIKHVLPFSDSMYRYALSIVHEPETARDIVQDSLTKIWSIRKDLNAVRKINAWVFRIVRNRCMEIIRRDRYTKLDEEMINMNHLNTVEERVIIDDFMSHLTQVIKTLPIKQQQVFHLREIEDLSYQDIAEICQISESDVKINIYRARKKIKKSMQKIDAYGL